MEHAFIFVVDGIRASEGFDDPLHRYIAPLHELVPHGSLLTYMENQTLPTTMPAHLVFMSGNAADYGLTMPYWGRQYFHNHTPTLFEVYRQRTGAPAESCWVLSNTPQIYDAHSSLMPGYGSEYRAERRCQFDDEMLDDWVWSELDSLMVDHEIDLILVNFHEVDRVAHWGDWSWHTEALQKTTRAIADFWFDLQQNPTYANNTVLFVTTDHGRHLDEEDDGWISHGCGCEGCRKTFLLALGPGIKRGYVTDALYSQKDLAPTVAHLMGLPFPYASGRVVAEILEDEDSAMNGGGGEHAPVVAAAGDRVVMVSESRLPDQPYDDGAFRVQVDLSEDRGETWTRILPEAGASMQRRPAAWTDGEVVLVSWYSYTSAEGSWTMHLWRQGPETDAWEAVFEEVIAGLGTPVGSLSFLDQDGRLFLMQDSPADEMLRTFVSEDRGLTWWAYGVVEHDDEHFPKGASQVQVGDTRGVAYSANVSFYEWGQDNDNTEIYWIRSEDDGESWDDPFQITDNPLPSIQPTTAVAPDGVVHVVWADMAPETFQINHATSTDDGATFSDPVRLTEAATGAWEPALAVDGQRIYLAWSQVLETDRAAVHVAAVTSDGLVDETVVSGPDGVARTPSIAPLGDGRSLVAWSFSTLDGPWEIQTAEVVTAGVPATAASGTIEPAVIHAGAGATLLFAELELTIGDDDRGVDRLQVVLPIGLEATDNVNLEVDGGLVEASVWIEGQRLWIEVADLIDADGAEVVLAFEVIPTGHALTQEAAAIELHHGDEPYTTPVSGDLLISVEVSVDVDGVGDPIDEGCECRATGRGRPSATLIALLGVFALARLVRRRR